MSLSRLRKGELLTLAGSIALICLMFATWAAPDASVLRDRNAELPGAAGRFADAITDSFASRLAESGWSALGWFVVLMIILVLIGSLALVVLTVTEQDTPVLSVVAFVWTSFLGIITSVVVLVRLTLAQPGLELGFSDSQVDVRGAAWLGLLALVLTTAGAWLAMGDERTEAATSVAPEVPVRPAPPATA